MFKTIGTDFINAVEHVALAAIKELLCPGVLSLRIAYQLFFSPTSLIPIMRNIYITTPVLILLCLTLSFSVKAPSKTTLTPFQDPDTALWGYKDERGQVAIPCQYEHACPFSEYGIANVVMHLKRTVDQNEYEPFCFRLDTKGCIVEQAFFIDNGCDYYEEGLARYVQNNKIGFSNERGQHVIKAAFDMAFPFTNGVAVVSNGCKVVYKKFQGNPSESYPVYVGGKWGVIDKKGNIIVPIAQKDSDTAIAALKHKQR